MPGGSLVLHSAVGRVCRLWLGPDTPGDPGQAAAGLGVHVRIIAGGRGSRSGSASTGHDNSARTGPGEPALGDVFGGHTVPAGLV